MIDFTGIISRYASAAALPPIWFFFRQIGRWLDSNTEGQFKEQFRQVLKSGAWFTYFELLNQSVSSVIDRVFGRTLLSWRMVQCSIFLSLIASAIFLIFNWWTLYAFKNYEGKVILVLFIFANRALLSLPLDYLTLVRVRYLCRKLDTQARLFSSIVSALVLDILTALLAVFLVGKEFDALIRLPFPSFMYTSSNNTFTHHTIGMVIYTLNAYAGTFGGRCFENALLCSLAAFDPRHSGQPLLSNPLFTTAIVTLAPSLIFYLYTISFVLLRISMFVLLPVARYSYYIKFNSPFLFVSNVVAAIAIMLLFCSSWVIRHILGV